MLKRAVVIIVSSITGMSTFAHGQYPGDECVDARTAYVGANYFDTTQATSSFPEPDDSQCAKTFLNWNGSRDVWFSFVPTVSEIHLFTTCDSSSYDTSMVLYASNCSNQVACNGDGDGSNKGCQPYYSYIEYPLTAGTQYFIRLGGYNGDFGTGTLSIDSIGGGNSSIWHVNHANGSPGDGTSWAQAFLDLQDALDVASSGDQIWMAQGTYTPSDTGGSNESQEASYRLIAGVEIYGGFVGSETNLGERDPSTYVVVLSGDLEQDDFSGGTTIDNAFHVVTADNLFGISPLIDGVAITQGNAVVSGGGLFILNYHDSSTAYPILKMCNIVNNDAKFGGGVHVETGGVTLILCKLIRNDAAANGGAIYSLGNLVVDNCLISANTANDMGGAMYCNGNQFKVLSSTIVQNIAGFTGGIYISSQSNILTNNIIWSNSDNFGDNRQLHFAGGTSSVNYNCIQYVDSTLPGVGNIAVNPRFLNVLGDDQLPGTGDENFRLMQLSPCIDAGDNTSVTTSIDLDGGVRQIDDPYVIDTGNNPNQLPVVDIGAYEHNIVISSVAIWSGSNSEYFNDYLNWLPNTVPSGKDTAMFNTIGSELIIIEESRYLDSIFVTNGDIVLDIANTTFQLLSTTDPLRITNFEEDTSLTFKGANGRLKVDGPLRLHEANISFIGGSTLEAPELWIGEGSVFSLDGYFNGNLTNSGSKVVPAGREIGSLYIGGNLFHQNQDGKTPTRIGVLSFDIAGKYDGDYDTLHVGGFADMTSAIELRWDNMYVPTSGDSYDLITVGTAAGDPSLVYCAGLPSDLVCRWATPRNFRGGSEVVVETTGPILFDSGTTTAISTTPNEIVVVDLDGLNGPDIAMTFPGNGGGTGNVVVLLNKGMSGNTWQGFIELAAIPVGINPMDIEVIDASNDGTADDLVVANYGSSSVSILTNNGSAVFTKTDITIDTSPRYIAVANFVEDGDGLDDIAVACDSFFMSILKNTTTLVSTSFTHLSSVSIPQPADIDPGDVNNDKDFDYILLNNSSDEILVYEGDGSGIFNPFYLAMESPLLNGSDAVELVFADLNRDGNDDAITVNEGGGSISVLLGNENNLGSASTVSVGASPQEITVSDFDNDGDDDFVISVIGTVSGERELVIIRNDTVTTIVLTAGDTIGSGSEPILVEHGDFNQDGLEDLASVIDLTPTARGQNSPAVSIFFNITATVSNCPADLDGDGSVAVGDILMLIAAWGSIDASLDLDESGIVDVGDLLVVIAAWGACP